MSIESIIIKFLSNIPEIYDVNGNLVKEDRFLSEYNSLKRYLLCNFEDDSILALQFEKDYKYVLSILVCMEIGLTYVPLHIDFPDNRINQIKQISGFEALLNYDLFEEIIRNESKDSQKKVSV